MLEEYSTSVTARGLMHPNQHGTTGGGWRPLTRPQWYSVSKKMQQHSQALKEEHCKHSLTTEELMTVLVPLKCKILTGKGCVLQCGSGASFCLSVYLLSDILFPKGVHSRQASTSSYPHTPSLHVQSLSFYKQLFHACTRSPYPSILQLAFLCNEDP